ncbi:MAG: mechanosensitive ion channel [Bacteroidaceae bacterium]|nr:mechanosensitive ion channel [Bacteroidaceae bacterium]
MSDFFTSILEYYNIAAGEHRILHWLIMLICILLIFVISNFAGNKIFIPLIKSFTKKTNTKWDDIILSKNVLKNAFNLVPPIIIIALLPAFINDTDTEYTVSIRILAIYITIVTIKLVCAILSSLYKLSNEYEKTKNSTLQGVFQMLKIAAMCVGGIIIISIIIDSNPVSILAGLGASAAVLMLVFKDSIMGLVAGVQLSANDMLRPGDWIQMPKYGADGNVVDVSLTTVKVQNWDKTITTIPPYALVSDSFQNWRGMFDSGGRRIKRSIYIDMNSIAFCSKEDIERYKKNGWIKEDCPDNVVNLGVFRNYLEDYLRTHPLVNKELISMVRQLQPTPHGLPLELYFFYNGTMWIPYEHAQADVFEHVFAILPEFGLKVFQSPTGKDLSALGYEQD